MLEVNMTSVKLMNWCWLMQFLSTSRRGQNLPVLTQHHIASAKLNSQGHTCEKLCVTVIPKPQIAINNDQVSQRNSNLAKRIMDETEIDTFILG